MISLVKPTINRYVENLCKPIASKVNPNLISFLTPCAAFLTVYLCYIDQYVLAGLSISLSLLDLLDGGIARAGGKTTKFGGFLDASLDRVHESIILIGIGYAVNNDTTWLLCSSVLAISLIISYVKAKAEASFGITQVGTNELSVGLVERTERLTLIAVGLVLFGLTNIIIISLSVLELILIIIAFFGLVTIIMRFMKAHELLSRA